MRNFLPFTFTVVLALIIKVHAYGSGAPTTVCTSMTPGHGSQPNAVSPYSIRVSANKYTPGASLTVNIDGGDYQGIILQARVPGSNTIVGKFVQPPQETKLLECSGSSNTITHSSTATKNSGATFTWQAPSSNVGGVAFVATVAQQKNTWWKNVESSVLTFEAAPAGTTPSSNGHISRTDIFSVVLALGTQMIVTLVLNKV